LAYVININSKAVKDFTAKLEKISRHDLPIAIRQTLNDAAYDVKLHTMPQTSDASFIKRKPTFWKAKSRVDSAKGFDVMTMQSTVGFLEGTKHSQAVRNLEQQEHGGTIDDKDFIAEDSSRHGGSYSQQVKAKNWLRKIDPEFNTTKWDGNMPSSIVQAKDQIGHSHKQKFFRAALEAGRGGYVLGNNKSQVLFRVTKLYKENKKVKFDLEPLYSFREGRVIKIQKKTHFMRNAALKSATKMEGFFNKNAIKRINK
jgi:hypothetical protein